MVANNNDRPVSALKNWLLIVSCLAAGLLLGLFICGGARNDLNQARDTAIDGRPVYVGPVIEEPLEVPIPKLPPDDGLKESR